MKRASNYSVGVFSVDFRVGREGVHRKDDYVVADALPNNVGDDFSIGQGRREVIVLAIDRAVGVGMLYEVTPIKVDALGCIVSGVSKPFV